MRPEFFSNLTLFDLEQELKMPVRVAYIGLWAYADRMGRFVWEPRKIKASILPYDEGVDFQAILEALCEHGMIEKYETEIGLCGRIPAFCKNQYISKNERPSEIPPSPTEQSTVKNDTSNSLDCDESMRQQTTDNGQRTTDNGQQTMDIVDVAPRRFKHPTLDEVKILASKAGLPDSEAEKFFNHYMANGWMVGKNRMKSLPHAIGYWASTWRERSGGNGRFQQSGPIRHTAEDYENDVGLPTTFKAPERKN